MPDFEVRENCKKSASLIRITDFFASIISLIANITAIYSNSHDLYTLDSKEL